ncbi:MAG: ATP-binding protein [Planctomycetota bacterium]
MATLTRVSREELVRDLGERLKAGPQDARRIFDAVCATLREFLQSGYVVEIEDLFALAVSGAPEIREDESGGFSAYAPKVKGLAARPIGAFRSDLARARAASIYYISRSEGRFHEILSDHFCRRGWNLVRARSAMEVHSRLERQPAVAIIFEHNVEGWRELLRELKCNSRTNGVPAVGLFPQSAKDEPVPSLCIEPDEVIYEPFDFAQFIRTAGSELAERVAAPVADSVQISFLLPGTTRERQAARTLVEEVLLRNRLPEEFTSQACAALDEALDNAVRHGHRGVECCTIGVRLILDSRRLVLAVRDSGAGFDHAAGLAAARERKGNGASSAEHLHRAAQALKTRRGGVAQDGGIARILKVVDRVEFNRAGNEIVISKFRPAASDAAAAQAS